MPVARGGHTTPVPSATLTARANIDQDPDEHDQPKVDSGFLSPHRPSIRPHSHENALSSPNANHTDVSQDGSLASTRTPSLPTISNSSSFVGHHSSPIPKAKPDTNSHIHKGVKGPSGSRNGDELVQNYGTHRSPFAFRPDDLAQMVDPKNVGILTRCGGTPGLLEGLGTHSETGLLTYVIAIADTAPPTSASPPTLSTPDASAPPSHPTFSATLAVRREVFGPNVLPSRPSRTLLQLVWTALKDKVLLLLCTSAAVSFALGLYKDSGAGHKPNDTAVSWVECAAIIVAVVVIAVVGSLNDWQKERQFRFANDKKEERDVRVIRDGREGAIDVKDVVVGDIALLEPGEIVPCDGVFLLGHNVRCDESGATGESDAIKKVPFEEWWGSDDTHTDCFVLSGSRVLEGIGRYVVIAVGPRSFKGRIMMALRGDREQTPLQLKVNHFAGTFAKIGLLVGLVLFFALMIRFFVQLGTNEPVRTSIEQGITFVNMLITVVTLLVVAIPEGLPHAVTLALAFTIKRMAYDKLLVRMRASCETSGGISVLCTSKTGVLTQNAMDVVAGSVGVYAKFVRELEENVGLTNGGETPLTEDPGAPAPASKLNRRDFSIDQRQLNSVLSPALRSLFHEAIAVNSTAFESEDPQTRQSVLVGSQTETALLKFARELGWGDLKRTRDAAEVVRVVPFSGERKVKGVVVKKPGGAGYRVYLTGASEVLARKCRTNVAVRVPSDSGPPFADDDEIATEEIDEAAWDNISRTIVFYANQTLRTIALCYRDFESWPPQTIEHEDQDEVPYEGLAQDLTLIGIIGIEDSVRPGVREAIAKCHRAGVVVKLCTGDNVLTSRSVAAQCGIFTPGGIVMEGPVFRTLARLEMVEVVPRLQVLARASPEDKKVLAEVLRLLGEVVGVVGGGADEGPALRAANIGFALGVGGTEATKEAADVVLMNDCFSAIVRAIVWGRCFNDAVRKCMQFQMSAGIAAVVVVFVSAVVSAGGTSVLVPVQLLWITIIMDAFAVLALTTDYAIEALLDRKPDRKNAPLFSANMYKQIMFQSIYQIIFSLVFHFSGMTIFGLEHTGRNSVVVRTLVFNAFVFAQIFNSINCRRLDNRLNVFEGITKNMVFLAITLIEICVQVFIVFVGGQAFQVTRITGREWGISLALGAAVIPLGAIVRLIPNGHFNRLFFFVGLLDGTDVLPTADLEPQPSREHRRPSFHTIAAYLQSHALRLLKYCILFILIGFPSFHALNASQLGGVPDPGSITTWESLASPSSTELLAAIERQWGTYLAPRVAEWKVIVTLACVLLGLSLTIFQIQQAASDPFTYVFAALVQLRALSGLVYAIILVVYFESDYTRSARFAMVWHKVTLESRARLWNTWVMLSLPAASTLWALFFYLLTILNFTLRPISDDRPNTPLALRVILQLIIAATTLSDIICLVCIYHTLKGYRDKHHAGLAAGS